MGDVYYFTTFLEDSPGQKEYGSCQDFNLPVADVFVIFTSGGWHHQK